MLFFFRGHFISRISNFQVISRVFIFKSSFQTDLEVPGNNYFSETFKIELTRRKKN